MSPNIRLFTDEDRAYAAAQWASGISQQRIAETFGYRKADKIAWEIGIFLRRYANLPPGGKRYARYGNAPVLGVGVGRKSLVKDAIANFTAKRVA